MGLLEDLKKRQESSQPTATLKEPESTHDIEKNLEVNPPAVAGTAVEPVVTKTDKVPSEGTECPTCGKTFKHLSRHKCKKAPVASAVTFPTDAMLDVILPTLNGPALDSYASQYGVTRYNPGDDPKFRETIKKLVAQQRDGVIEEPFVDTETKPDPEPAVKETKSESKKETKTNARFDLIIGAEIVQSEGSNIVYFYSITNELEEMIKQALGTHWAEVEYGKGKAALCECLNLMIEKGDFDASTIVVTTRSPVYNIVADTLRQHARNVIVGL